MPILWHLGRRGRQAQESEPWLAAAALAILAIAAAWCVVGCWSILAEFLHVLHRALGWRPAGWLLEMGIKRQWVGFSLGSLLAAAILVVADVVLHR